MFVTARCSFTKTARLYNTVSFVDAQQPTLVIVAAVYGFSSARE